jgi:hypothetical protein
MIPEPVAFEMPIVASCWVMRWAWLVLAACSVTCGVVGAEIARPVSHEHVLPHELDAAFATERRAAAEIGIDQQVASGLFPVAADSPSTEWTSEVALEAGQCLAAIVGMSEELEHEHQLRLVDIRDRANDVLASAAEDPSSPSVKVTQVQYCSPEPALLTVRVVLAGHPSSVHPPTQLRYLVLRSPSGRRIALRQLNRTRLSTGVRRRAGADEAAALLATRPAMPGAVAAEVPITFAGGARLLPESRPTWLALLRAVSLESRTAQQPLVDRSWPAGAAVLSRPTTDPDAARGDRPAPHGARIALDGTIHRVLAAADLGDLGAPCVAVRFTRRTAHFKAPIVRRVGLATSPGAPGFTLAATDLPLDGLVSTDRSCPAQGLALYVVPDGERADYGVQVFSEAGAAPEGAAATPSAYDGSMAEPRAAGLARERCGRGEAARCLELGELLAAITYPERDVLGAATALETGCAQGSAEACLRRGLLDGESDRHWIERSCSLGMPLGCAHLGDALRLGLGGAPDYPAARAAYASACRGGVQQGCADLTAMRRYLLGGGETDSLATTP